MRCTIHFDGGSRGNPGPAGVGFIITDTDTGHTVYEAGHFLGKCTNNVAEYQGLIKSLQAALELRFTEVDIISDSELLVRQINGQYRVKSPHLQPLYNQANGLLRQFTTWQIKHILRTNNHRADELANLAMDGKSDIVLSDRPADMPSTGTAEEVDDIAISIRWAARLTSDSTSNKQRCPTACSKDGLYHIGPTMPDGLCIHAAAAILSNGPLQWPASQRHGQIRCPVCQIKIEMSRTD